VKPYCSQCVVFGVNRRGISRAVYMAAWVTGEVAWLCKQHAAGCKRGGGVVYSLPKDLEFEDIAPSEMLERLRVASVARRDPVTEAEVERAVREVLPDVLMRMFQAGASAGGLSPPEERTNPGAVTTGARTLQVSEVRPNESEST
jgi:hypothetical protein